MNTKLRTTINALPPIVTADEPHDANRLVVEHAVFTSARTREAQGYQLVACSAGIDATIARELKIWCPSHDALIDDTSIGMSINFHPLEFGGYCISRTTADGAEYSGRRGPRVTTHCLVVSAEAFERAANHPMALLQAAQATGKIDLPEPLPRHLAPFALPARCSVIDLHWLKTFVDEMGADRTVSLVQLAVNTPSLGFVSPAGSDSNLPPADRVIAALLYLLPVECRREISFTSGLRHSARRPFRWMAIEHDASTQRRMARQHGATIVNLASRAALDELLAKPGRQSGWTAYISECLRQDALDLLEKHLRQPRPGTEMGSLSRLGDQLLHTLTTDAREGEPSTEPTAMLRIVHGAGSEEAPEQDTVGGAATPESDKPVGPSLGLSEESPDVLEKLETLDDVVFDAIAGDTLSLDRLRALWPEVLSQLGSELVEQSREQYLRYALTVWNDFIKKGEGGPERASAALDVVCLLSDD